MADRTGPGGGSDEPKGDGPNGPRVVGLEGPEWRARWAQSGWPDRPKVAGLASLTVAHPFFFFFFFSLIFFSINITQILLIFHQLSLNFSYSLQIHFIFTICSHIL